MTQLRSLFAALVLVACGGDDSTTIALLDGSADTTTNQDGASSDGSPDDAASDTSASDATSDAGACNGPDAGRGECIKCCEKEHPVGAQVFYAALEACACVPAICGANDAGVDGGGAFGKGACDKTCGTTTAPDKACAVCLQDAVVNKNGPGPCAASVQTGCNSSSACKAFEACAATCPN